MSPACPECYTTTSDEFVARNRLDTKCVFIHGRRHEVIGRVPIVLMSRATGIRFYPRNITGVEPGANVA
jgi:hypothetical protein